MTYDTSRIDDNRAPLTVCEIDLDSCSLAYGVGACTAGLTSGNECYNTFFTCQDTANYAKTTKTYRFYQSVSYIPIGEIGYPAIDGEPRFTPTQIDPKGTLGRRGVASLNLKDFADDDIGIDPYFATRAYDAESQGSFFGKLKARNPYYKGRSMRIRQGYINDPFSWSDFDSRHYIIDSIDLSSKGAVKITGKDILKLADDKKAVAPAASTGTLVAAITDVATTLTLQTGEGADYDASGSVRIDKEVITYTSITTDTLNGLGRGAHGTEAKAHSIDDDVQQCLEYTAENVVDIIHELLNTYAGISESFLPYDAGLAVPTGTDDLWDLEKADWLSGNDLTYIITKPTGVTKLLQRLCEQNLIYIWFDERDQEIKLRAIAPALKNETPPTLTDASSIVADTMSNKDNAKDRVSQIWVYYDIEDVTDGLDKAENYKKLHVQVDSDSENVNAYDEKSIRVIYADWLGSANAGLIVTLAGRLLSRYAGTPSTAKFKVDKKDASVWTGDSIILKTFAFQDIDGSSLTQSAQILKVSDIHDKQQIEIEAQTWDYSILSYGFITPDTMGDYLTETDDNKAAYGFICENTGLMSNGDAGYLIA